MAELAAEVAAAWATEREDDPSPFGPPPEAIENGWTPDEYRAEMETRQREAFEAREREAQAAGGVAPDGLIVTSLKDVKIRSTSFFWPKRIPNGGVTLLAGDGGLGKGTFAYMLAAWATKGENGTPRGPVVILAGEDTAEEDIKPKILAYGGNPELVEIVHAPFGGSELEDQLSAAIGQRVELRTTVKLPGDAAKLAATVARLRPVLIVVDPLNSHLSDGKKTNQAEDMASVLVPLDAIAKAFELAVLVVDHVGKAERDHHVDKILGSVQKRNTARSVLIMEAGASDDERLIFHQKANKGRREPTLTVELEERTVREGMQVVETVVTTITGTTEKTYGELQEQRRTRSKPAGSRAREWIEEKFAAVDRHRSKELEQEVNDLGEFSWRTAKSEMNALGIYYFKKDEVGYWIRNPMIPFLRKRTTFEDNISGSELPDASGK